MSQTKEFETGHRQGFCDAISVMLDAVGAVLPAYAIGALELWHSDLVELWLDAPFGETLPPVPQAILTFSREPIP